MAHQQKQQSGTDNIHLICEEYQTKLKLYIYLSDPKQIKSNPNSPLKRIYSKKLILIS
jgi:hypothetical protein